MDNTNKWKVRVLKGEHYGEIANIYYRYKDGSLDCIISGKHFILDKGEYEII